MQAGAAVPAHAVIQSKELEPLMQAVPIVLLQRAQAILCRKRIIDQLNSDPGNVKDIVRICLPLFRHPAYGG